MFPISDDNPIRSKPYVTWGLIAVCTLIFLWQSSLPVASVEAVFLSYGAIPAHIFGGDAQAAQLIAPELTLISSQYLHGGLAHLFGNMLFLYIFGDNIEAVMGHFKFLLFYTLAGIAAALGHGLLAVTSDIPMIGASGAISGVLGAYLLLYPHARVRVLFLPLPIPIFRIFAVPAVMVLGIWFIIQFVSAAMSNADEGGVAFWAHVAGFVAGMLMLPLFKKSGIAYWQAAFPKNYEARTPSGPWSKPQRDVDQSEPNQKEPRRWRRGPWG
jgi:rhomboid family protein